MDIELTVDAAEMGAILKEHPRVVADQARRGLLPGFKVGGKWRFIPSKVIAHLEAPKDKWAQPARAMRRSVK